MMKVNLIGDYEGKYRISVFELILLIVNLALLVALILYQQFSE